MIKKLLVLLLAITAINAHSQSLFEDGSGESIILKNGNLVPWFNFRVNSSKESFTFSYVEMKSSKAGKTNQSGYRIDKSIFGGADVKIDMKDGQGGILKEGKLNSGLSFSGIFGIQRERYTTTKPPVFSNPVTKYIKAGLTYKKHTMLDTTLVTSNELKKVQAFIIIHHNSLFRGKVAKNNKFMYHLLGISFGYKGTNNYEDLDDGINSELLKSSGDMSIHIDKAGKIGDFKTYDSFPLRIDYGFIPPFLNKRVGINLYGRAKFNEPKTPINLGLGLFFAKENEPTNVIGGVGWQFNDVNNKTGLSKNSSVFVYIGYTID